MPLKTGRDYPDQTATGGADHSVCQRPRDFIKAIWWHGSRTLETRITTFSPFQLCQGSVETGCEQGASQSQGFFYSDRMNNLIQDERTEQDPKPARKSLRKFKTPGSCPLFPYGRKRICFCPKPVQNVTINPVLGPTGCQ